MGVSESLIRSLIPRLKKKLAEELAKEGIMV
jgi:DNA-directed RNA polymerase specialized sigma24 family protein